MAIIHSNRPLLLITLLTFVSQLAVTSQADVVTRNVDVVLDGESFNLDLDLDGTPDFRFSDMSTSATVTALGYNLIFVDYYGPLVFSPGDAVGSQSALMLSTTELYGQSSGAFEEVGSTGFIGLRLSSGSSDDVFFGFAEITRGSTIIGIVGFENSPNTPALIPVPEPSTSLFIGCLALVGVVRRSR